MAEDRDDAEVINLRVAGGEGMLPQNQAGEWRGETITVSQVVDQGRFDWTAYGEAIAWWRFRSDKHGRVKTEAIRNAGSVHLGMEHRYLGVVPYHTRFFLSDGGRVWKVRGKRLPAPPAAIGNMSPEAKRVWADHLARQVEELVTPAPEIRVVSHANERYLRVVRALVARRVTDALGLGVEVSATSLARGIDESWSVWRLTHPRHPTLMHAIQVSLVLALDEDIASELIELGALCELRMPVVSREAARSIFRQAARLLAYLCPAWWSQGYAMRWSQYGSISRVFRVEYVRCLEVGAGLGADLGTVLGMFNETKVDNRRGKLLSPDLEGNVPPAQEGEIQAALSEQEFKD